MSEIPDEIMAELRRIVRSSGPFDDLHDLQIMWKKAFPQDQVYLPDYAATEPEDAANS